MTSQTSYMLVNVSILILWGKPKCWFTYLLISMVLIMAPSNCQLTLLNTELGGSAGRGRLGIQPPGAPAELRRMQQRQCAREGGERGRGILQRPARHARCTQGDDPQMWFPTKGGQLGHRPPWSCSPGWGRLDPRASHPTAGLLEFWLLLGT